MKKLLTVIAIIALVAGTVFAAAPSDADGNAEIKVQTKITEAYPAFQLQAASIATASGTGFPATSNVAPGQPVPTATVTVTTDDLLTKNAVITFNVNQIKNSRAICNYELSVAVTDLELVKDAKGVKYEGEITAKEKFAVDTTAPVVSAVTVPNISADSSVQSPVLGLQYNGRLVEASTTNPVKVATFTSTWEANANATAGDYEATVTLTVAAY